MRSIWVEDKGRQFYGHAWIISSEVHDGIEYTANSMEEAVAKYEKNVGCKVGEIHVVK